MGGSTADKPRGPATLAGIASLAACLLLAAPAAADTFKPTRFDDPEPGKCKAHDCSLREAVIAANDREGKDRVELRKGTYRLTIADADAGPEDADPTTGDLDVVDSARLRGKGSKRTTVRAAFESGGDRILRLIPGIENPEGLIALEGVTVRGGQSGEEPGGGILIAGFGQARLDDVMVASNSTNEGPPGGGIYAQARSVQIARSTIKGNLGTIGGGIFLASSIGTPRTTIRASTIQGNTSYEGGGILVDGTDHGFSPDEPVLEITNSTVAENHSLGNGGEWRRLRAARC